MCNLSDWVVAITIRCRRYPILPRVVAKRKTQHAMIEAKANWVLRHLVVRTTNVYGYDARAKNFLMALLPRLAMGERAEVANDQLGTPTHVEDLCASMRVLLERRVEGIVHVAGPDLVNRVEWLQEAARTFGLEEDLVSGHETNQLAQPARRPLRAGLKTHRLSRLGLPLPRGLRDGLALMRSEKQAAAEQAYQYDQPGRVSEIIELTRQGQDETVILNHMKNNRMTFRLSVDDLNTLKANNVSQRVISAMQTSSGTVVVNTPPPKTVVVREVIREPVYMAPPPPPIMVVDPYAPPNRVYIRGRF